MDYIDVQTLDGRHVLINRQAIVTVGGARTDKGQKVLTDKAACLITLVDGKYVTVAESCDAINRRLQDRRTP
jgi:uncharacterized protein YlzI (FlbEa/FlbD family)